MRGQWHPLKVLDGKEGAPTSADPPGPSAALAHPHPPLKQGGNGVLPCDCIFEFCPDFGFNSRVSQDLRERWDPLAKWVTLEKG